MALPSVRLFCRPQFRRLRIAIDCAAIVSVACVLVPSIAQAQSRRAKSGKPAAIAPANGVTLRYGFKVGTTYVYEVAIDADLGEQQMKSRGRIRYSVKSADDNEIVLQEEGNIHSQLEARPSRPPVGQGMFVIAPLNAGIASEVTIDRLGKVTGHANYVQLPYLLGPLSLLIIESLPEDRRQSWESNSAVAVGTNHSARGNGPFNRVTVDQPTRFAGIEIPNFVQPFVTAATEQKKYTRGSTTGSQVTVKRQVELKSQGAVEAGLPTLERTSGGEFTFDTKQGVPIKSRFKDVMQISIRNGTIRVPFTVTYRLLTEQEVAEHEKKMKEMQAESEARIKDLMQPLDDEGVKKALAQLDDENTRHAALQRLAKGPPNDQAVEVSKKILELFAKGDTRTGLAAGRALKVWRTGEIVPELVELLKRERSRHSYEVVQILMEFKDEPPYNDVNNPLRVQVSKELGAMLSNRDDRTRRSVLQVLSVWATPANVPALIEQLHDRRPGDKRAIVNALAATKTERAAEALAKQLPLQPGVAEALMDMGPIAERFVIPFVNDREQLTRREACRVLGAIGTQKSREALQAVVRNGDSSEGREAERALRLIDSRSTETQ